MVAFGLTKTCKMKEIWKKVKGFDCYEVSNFGHIRRVRLKRSFCCRPLNPYRTKAGYEAVTLVERAKIRKVFVHVLVLEAFKGKAPPKHQCNHKNGIKHFNKLHNLEWVTSKENNIHKHQVLKKAIGKNHVMYGKVGKNHNRSKSFIVTAPSGEDFKIIGLRNFCKEQGLTLSAMYNLCVSNRRTFHKGWKCRFV